MPSKVVFQGQEVFEIRNGSSVALFYPDQGGRLLSWKVGGVSIIYWPEETNWANVPKTRGGNPILFPFIARHMVDGVQGKWKDSTGKVYDLPVHGFARESSFDVLPDSGNDVIRMRLTDSPATAAGYPFKFQFVVEYRLIGDSELQVTFETTNTGTVPLPYYAGHHFYFSIPHEERASWRITLPLPTGGRQEADGSTSLAELTGADQLTTLADSKLVDRFHLATSGSGSGGAAERIKPTTVVSLMNETAGRIILLVLGPSPAAPSSQPQVDWFDVTTWTEKPDSDFYCVEPWLGLPNTIHYPNLGLRWVAPGGTEVAVCTIKVL